MGIFSSIGKGLGFMGEGGGFMQGMGNVSSLMGMFGGGKGDQGQQGPEMGGGATGGGVGGFELDNYIQPVQGYAKGGIPNKGKPAIIVDEETGKPTGRMNEEGAETIVPAEQVPQTTRNMTVDPSMTAFGSPTPSQSIVPQTYYEQGEYSEADNEDLNEAKQYKKAAFPTADDKDNETKGQHDKESTIRIDKKEEGIAPKDKSQMSDIIRGLARMTGYYYDMRKNRYGLGKSALTMWLDNVEGKEAQDAKGKSSVAISKQTGEDKAALQRQKHADALELQRLKNKGKGGGGGPKTEEEYKELAYEDLQSAIKNNTLDDIYYDSDGNVNEDEFLKDQLRYYKKGEKADISRGEMIKKGRKGILGIGKKDPEYERIKWGYDDVTGDAKNGKPVPSDKEQADETNTIAEDSKSIDKKTGKKIIYKNGKWVEDK